MQVPSSCNTKCSAGHCACRWSCCLMGAILRLRHSEAFHYCQKRSRPVVLMLGSLQQPSPFPSLSLFSCGSAVPSEVCWERVSGSGNGRILSLAKARGKLEDIMLSRINQSRKDKCCQISLNKVSRAARFIEGETKRWQVGGGRRRGKSCSAVAFQFGRTKGSRAPLHNSLRSYYCPVHLNWLRWWMPCHILCTTLSKHFWNYR